MKQSKHILPTIKKNLSSCRLLQGWHHEYPRGITSGLRELPCLAGEDDKVVRDELGVAGDSVSFGESGPPLSFEEILHATSLRASCCWETGGCRSSLLNSVVHLRLGLVCSLVTMSVNCPSRASAVVSLSRLVPRPTSAMSEERVRLGQANPRVSPRCRNLYPFDTCLLCGPSCVFFHVRTKPFIRSIENLYKKQYLYNLKKLIVQKNCLYKKIDCAKKIVGGFLSVVPRAGLICIFVLKLMMYDRFVKKK